MTGRAIASLLADLGQAGVTLWVEDGRLRYRGPKGAMTADRRDAVNRIKPDLIRHLEDRRTAHQADFPLSASQSRFLMIEELVDVGATHTLGGAAWLRGPLDEAALTRAWRAIVDAHPALRTTFDRSEGRARQIVHPAGNGALVVCGPVSADVAEAEATALIASPIDPFSKSCVHGVLWRVDAESAVLGVALHHAIGDGWSVGLMLHDLAAAYRYAASGDSPVIPGRPGYVEVIAAQDKARAGDVRAWWRDRLRDWPHVLDLPTDIPRPVVQSFKGDVVREVLTPTEAAAIQTLARDLRISTFSLLSAVFGAVLTRTAGADRMLLGVGVSGRDAAGQEMVVGPFVNTLPLPLACDWAAPAREFLTATATEFRACLAHQSVPFNTLVEDLGLPRDVSRPPLIQTLITEQIPHPPPDFGALKLDPIEVETGASRMDLYLSVEWARDGCVTLDLEFCVALFQRERAAAILSCVTAALRELTSRPDAPLADVLLGVDRAGSVLSGKPLATTRGKGLSQRFLDVVRRAPGDVAIFAASGDGGPGGLLKLTYADLAGRAEALASRLRAAGIKPADLVAIDTRRSADSIVAILGVVLCGAAYLPLDAEHPDPRWPVMLSKAGVRLILRHAATAGRAGVGAGPPTMMIDGTAAPEPRDGHLDPVWTNLGEDSWPAYVMFTSGSTGEPKAVAVDQHAVLRLVDGVAPSAAPDCAAIAPQVMLAASLLGFDASTLELWVPLLTGATIALAGPDLVAPEDLAEFMETAGVDTAWFTAGFFHALVDSIPHSLAKLDTVIAGGDSLSAPHVDRLLREMAAGGNRRGRVLNGYGPTETTTFATLHGMRSGDRLPAALPLGQPLGGTEIRLLDDALRPVPRGAVAEIVVGGSGVAAGYLGRPELTSERFVDLSDAPGRFYRTGDLGRIGEDGTLRYLGRRDTQIKLRGFRIELAEVEAALADQPGVAAAVAAIKQIGRVNQLVGYVVPAGEAVDIDAIRSALETRLPDYMTPARIEQIPDVPVGRTGKVDRTCLPTPNAEASAENAAPEGEREQLLASIWADTLGIDPASVGRNSDFFGLGGDSILAMQVAHALSARGWEMSLVDLLRHQDVRSVAARMSPKTAARISVPDDSGPLDWSPIQARLLAAADNTNQCFAQALWLAIAPEISLRQIEEGLRSVTEQHANFGLQLVDDGPVFTEDRSIRVRMYTEDIAPKEVEEDILRGISLRTGPVLSCGIVARGDVATEVFLAASHAVIDIAAWRFLLADLVEKLIGQGRLNAPRPTWRGYLQDLGKLAVDRADGVETLPQPDGAARPPETRTCDLQTAHGRLSASQTRRILAIVEQVPGARLEDVLVASISASLSDRLGDAARRVDLERHGRDLPGVSAVGLVGWCTVFSPVQLDSRPDPTLRALAAAAGARKAMTLEGKLWLAWQTLADDADARARARAVPPAWALVNLQRADQSEFAEVEKDSLIRPLDRPLPETEGPELLRAHPVEIAARVEKGVLWFDVLANPAAMSAEQVCSGMTVWLERLAETQDRPALPVADVRVFPQSPLDQAQLDRVLEGWAAVPDAAVIGDVLPLSPQQFGMMLETLNAPDPLQHLEQLRLRFDRPLDPARLNDAWWRVVAAHPVLRTAFVEDGGTWVQIVLRDPAGKLRVTASVAEAAAAEDLTPFPEGSACLWRLTLSEGGHALCLTAHHAILDGWSMARVLAGLQAAYADPNWTPAFDPGLAPYLAWLAGRDPAKTDGFWSDWMAGLPDWKRLHLDDNRRSDGHETLVMTLPPGLADDLARVARQNSVSLAALFQTALAATLMATEDRAETALYVTDAGRPEELPELAEAVGLFIVSVPMRFAASEDGVRVAAKAVSERLREAVEHWPPPPMSRPLSETLLVFENYPRGMAQSVPDAPHVVEMGSTGARTRFAMAFLVVPGAAPAQDGNGPGDPWRIELVIDRSRVSRAQGEAVLRAVQAALVALKADDAGWANVISAARAGLGSDRLDYLERQHLEPDSLTPEQEAISDLWAEVLGHTAFSLDDRLEEAGGNSLALALLLAAIKRRLGLDAVLADLAAQPTVRGHAALIARLKSGSAAIPRRPLALTTLRDGQGEGPELLILPGAAGDPSAYRDLADHLPDDWRVLAASYGDAGDPDALVPVLRKDLVARGGRRPVVLGHSYGAALGASLAASMTGGLLGLCVLDQPLPVELPGPEGMTDAALAAEIARAAASYNDRAVRLDGEGPPDAQLARALAAEGLVPEGTGAEFGRLVITRYRDAIAGLSDWQPPRLGLPLLVIRASESEATGATKAPDLGWSRHSATRLDCVTVHGGHISVLRSPAVSSLARVVTRFVHERYTTT